MSGSTSATRFHLLDAIALVVGYGLASMLVRSYWPGSSTPSAWEIAFIGLVFLWLGLAMSGPLVLLIRKPPAVRTRDEGEARDEQPAERRSWAELAWLIIGSYWLGLTMLVVPSRMHGTRPLDGALLGVLPVIAGLVLRFFGPPTMQRRSEGPSWTHGAGVWLVVTWPFAWGALIALGTTLL